MPLCLCGSSSAASTPVICAVRSHTSGSPAAAQKAIETGHLSIAITDPVRVGRGGGGARGDWRRDGEAEVKSG